MLRLQPWIIRRCASVAFSLCNLCICASGPACPPERVVYTSHTRWKHYAPGASLVPKRKRTGQLYSLSLISLHSFLPVTLTRVCSQAGWEGWVPALSGKKRGGGGKQLKRDVPVFPNPSASIGGSRIESLRLPDAVWLRSLVYSYTFHMGTADFLLLFTVMSQQGLSGVILLRMWPVKWQ